MSSVGYEILVMDEKTAGCVVEYDMRLRVILIRVYKGYIEYAFGLMRLDILCVCGDMRLKDALAMGCVWVMRVRWSYLRA